MIIFEDSHLPNIVMLSPLDIEDHQKKLIEDVHLNSDIGRVEVDQIRDREIYRKLAMLGYKNGLTDREGNTQRCCLQYVAWIGRSSVSDEPAL